MTSFSVGSVAVRLWKCVRRATAMGSAPSTVSMRVMIRFMFRTAASPLIWSPGCRWLRSTIQRGTSTSKRLGQVAPLRVAKVAAPLALEVQHALDLLGHLGLGGRARLRALDGGGAVRGRWKPGLAVRARRGRPAAGLGRVAPPAPPSAPAPPAPLALPLALPLARRSLPHRLATRGGRGFRHFGRHRRNRGGLRGPARFRGRGLFVLAHAVVCSDRGTICRPQAVSSTRLERRRSRTWPTGSSSANRLAFGPVSGAPRETRAAPRPHRCQELDDPEVYPLDPSNLRRDRAEDNSVCSKKEGGVKVIVRPGWVEVLRMASALTGPPRRPATRPAAPAGVRPPPRRGRAGPLAPGPSGRGG